MILWVSPPTLGWVSMYTTIIMDPPIMMTPWIRSLRAVATYPPRMRYKPVTAVIISIIVFIGSPKALSNM